MSEDMGITVLDLGKYKIGDSPYWLSIQHPGAHMDGLEEEDAWIFKYHSKVLYDRKLTNSWNISQFKRQKIPKLGAFDFQSVVMLITGQFTVAPYKIESVMRSYDTGEYFYLNDEGYWMPQEYLFDTETAAIREKARVIDMIKRWINNHSQ